MAALHVEHTGVGCGEQHRDTVNSDVSDQFHIGGDFRCGQMTSVKNENSFGKRDEKAGRATSVQRYWATLIRNKITRKLRENITWRSTRAWR